MPVIRQQACGGRRSRRGAAAAEMAVVLPTLLVIALGCVDFARFAYAYITITNAGRAAAGYGSVNPPTTNTMSTWQAKVQQVAVDDASSLSGFTTSNVTVSQVADTGGLWRAQVTVTYQFKTMLSWTGIPATMNLTRTVQMRGTR